MFASNITRRSLGYLWVAAALICLLELPSRHAVVQAAEIASAASLDHTDEVCAGCHSDIYKRYEQSSMARGSGLATQGLITGGFHHKPSNIDYKVFERDGVGWMSYSRPASDPKGALEGERRLEYYIGSGHRGRTYLYNEDGRWYELPINFYTRRSLWDMAPAFDNAATMPAPLPTDPNCLHCHATNVQPSLSDVRNHYADAPFRQGGIGCSACHGDPAKHLAEHGHGAIVNPGKLLASQRDSACIQCHLEGDAVVYRPGKSLAKFIPGDNLSDTAVYFVRATQQSGGARATSQYEALLRSACKRATGDKLICTTCHDAHYDPPVAERVAYYRARCLSCHTQPAMATHHAEQPDCAKCHMPSRSTVDISHEQVTDHDIEARPAGQSALRLRSLNDDVELVPVGNFAAGDREFGLAYAQLAQRGDRAAAKTAFTSPLKNFLRPARPTRMSPSGWDICNRSPAIRRARKPRTALPPLEANPMEPTALANLAVIDAGSGHVPEAIRLLETSRQRRSKPDGAAGLNLAFIECNLNQPQQARSLLQRLQRSNPDDLQLRLYLQSGNYGGQHCSLP